MALILVVDDQDYLRTLVEMMLKSKGHEVIQAKSGTGAVSLCQDIRVDLVITDLAMPGMDGIELIRALRRSHSDVPILAISGNFTGEFLKVATLLGALETLEKPFDQTGLLAMVDKILGKQTEGTSEETGRE